MAVSTISATGLASNVSQLGKNLVQNGAMTVAQKGSLALGSGGTTTQIAVDRWKVGEGGGVSRFTVTQDTDSPTGFSNSIKIDCTTADTSVAGADYAALHQGIEAQNLQHLGYAAAGSLGTTLSFRVKSPKTGIHCVGLTQLDEERYYIREYTVASANTWETHSVYFPGDDDGTITNDTGEGLRVFFALHGAGANQGNGVANAWTVWPSSVIKYMTANQVNVFDDAANNFFLSGVQLEVGAIATDFEHEPFSVTLAKCQRYFFRLNDLDSSMAFMSGQAISATRTRAVIHLPVTMRNTAYGGITLALSDATHFSARAVNVAKAASGIAAQGSAGGSAVYLDLTIASTTAGDSILHESDTANAYVDFSSEI